MHHYQLIKLTLTVLMISVLVPFVRAQQETFTPVIDQTLSSYNYTSYQYLHSVTLSPGFTFTPSASYPKFSIVAAGQTSNPDNPNLAAGNNVRTDIIKVPGISSESQISSSNSQTQVSYMDGLGRVLERISAHGSPLQKDIVQLMSYDKFGRENKQYLPYTATSSNGSYQAAPVSAQQAFYQNPCPAIAPENYPFAVTVYDSSPLERVLESGAPGADWQPGNHSAKSQFRLNASSDNIRIWTVDGPSGSTYAATQLSVNDITDENGNHVLSFTNKLGQLVDKKVQSGASTYLETVYIYDDAGNIACQVSPEGVKRINTGSAGWSSTFVNTWATAYTYDAKNRLVTKQAPGAAPSYMVYDSYGRLVLLQDGRIRNANGSSDRWYFTKYDAANRTILSGLYTYADPGTAGNSNREKLQNYLDGVTFDNTNSFAYESRTWGTSYGYSNHSFPANIADADVLSVNYYDDYDFNNDAGADYSYAYPGQTPYANTATTDASGMLTGTKKRVISPGGNNGGWINQAIFYDEFGNVIQKQTNNLLNQSALDITSNAYDIYAGHITQSKQVKSQGSGVAVANKLTYDLMDRLTQVAMNINNGQDQVVAAYEYNELGQMKDKKLHQKADASFLQTVDYRYNIRGWLTSINNSSLSSDGGVTNGDSNDLFGMSIAYNQPDVTGLGNTPLYNGKISAFKWKANDAYASSSNPVRERSYVFSYDKVDRITLAHYTANSGSAWNAETGGYDETVSSYDDNGNIKALQRNALASGATAPTLIDNLTYNYLNNASNQLASVSDASGNTMGFNDGANSTSEYQYDSNGNMMQDANKNQTISYNDLNKVSSVAVSGGGSIEYTYDASGARIRKTVFNASHAAINQLDYLDGFVYANSTLAYFSTAEGRVTAGSQFTYEYFLKDHLGNTRVSFTDNGNGGAKIIQENEYYAFGMTMQGMVMRTPQPSPGNKQLFNAGSELQDDLGYENSYSTAFREYDPALGRFNAVDPMVDKYAGWSPYNFAFNDPVGMNDPDGADANGNVDGPPSIGPSWIIPGYNTAQNYWKGSVFSQFSPEMQNLITNARNQAGNNDTHFSIDASGNIAYSSLINIENRGNEFLSYSYNSISFEGSYNSPGGNVNYVNTTKRIPSISNNANQGGPGPWSTAVGLTFSWAFGTGDDHRTFTNNAVANSFRDARVVNQAREYWYKQVNAGNKTIYDGLTNFLGKKVWSGGNFGLSGIIAAGPDPMEQFVGSFTPAISSDGINLNFTIQNTTSFKSLMYGIAPDWSRSTWGPGGNLTQTYIFTEPINFNRINRFK
jgi:RHS repeat-associated protein